MQRRRKQVSIFLFLSRLPSVSPRLQLHVLYSRVSMVFSLWYLLFRCPCPCLGTPSGSVSTRNLPLPLPFSHRPTLSLALFYSLFLSGGVPTPLSRRHIHRTMQRRAYIQMERLAFPRVHWRVQLVATRETRGSLATKTQTESWQRGGRDVIVKPRWHSSFLINEKPSRRSFALPLSDFSGCLSRLVANCFVYLIPVQSPLFSFQLGS